MKTLTKTKLTVKTAVGIALIGGIALAAGSIGYNAFKKYNPILPIQQPQQNQTVTAEPSFYGNFAGKNVKDVDARCGKQVRDYQAMSSFFNINEIKLTNEGLKYSATDFACFSKDPNKDYYVGGAQSSTAEKYSTPQGVTSTQYNKNGDNNYCCDLKKYYSPEEVNNCRALVSDNTGRLSGGALDCAKQGKKFACYSWYSTPKKEVASCTDTYEECRTNNGQTKVLPTLYACPVGSQSCGFWGMTNNRGRAGFDLCAQNGYEGVCVNKFTGYYIGCKKPSENKCTYINIYSAPRERDVNLEADASVCDTGYKAISKSCQVWVNDINSVAGKQANIDKKNCAAAGYSRVCVNKFTGEAAGCATKGSNQCYNVNFNTGEATLGLNLVSNSDLDACSTGVQDKITADSFCDPLFKKQAYLAKAQTCISRSTGSEQFYGLCLSEPLGGTVYNAGENGCLSNLNSESCAAAGGHTCWLKDFATGEYKYGLTGKTQ